MMQLVKFLLLSSAAMCSMAASESICEEDQYFSKSAGSCIPCTACKPGQIRWIKCFSNMDTVCGGPPSFFKNIEMDLNITVNDLINETERTTKLKEVGTLTEPSYSTSMSTYLMAGCLGLVAVLAIVAVVLGVRYYNMTRKGRSTEYAMARTSQLGKLFVYIYCNKLLHLLFTG